MQRRHLFDYGYPVTTATRLAGREALRDAGALLAQSRSLQTDPEIEPQ